MMPSISGITITDKSVEKSIGVIDLTFGKGGKNINILMLMDLLVTHRIRIIRKGN